MNVESLRGRQGGKERERERRGVYVSTWYTCIQSWFYLAVFGKISSNGLSRHRVYVFQDSVRE